MATSNNQPTSIHVVTLNCWGLKYISKQRRERLAEIGHQLAIANPPPQIVGLQECWTQEDYLEIRRLTSTILPYGKFYHAGFFGAGLAILSAWPIEESSMFAYPLNGRPAAFYRGDWFVGKGVASARVRVGSEMADIVEVFCTHLHAPYEAEHEDSYACHRTAQAWEIAKKMRHAAERGHTVLGLGDFNMLPGSLAHQIIEAHSPVRDVWLLSHPISKSTTQLTVQQALSENGSTCDSLYNTWRWSKQMQKDLGRGQANEVSLDTVDPDAKRLDYIFFASTRGAATQWHVEDVKVGMTQRHPTLETSLSDHFSVEATLVRSAADRQVPSMAAPLSTATYDEILDMTAKYMLRERRQRSWRMLHFKTQLGVTVGCLVAVWWSPKNYVSFLLMLLSTIGLTAGVLDGLMGGLFVKGEIRALKEFQWEVENARKLASKS